MKISVTRISLIFTAGCLGGLANSILVWLFGVLGVTGALGVQLAPHLSAPWLYPRLVWGGLWALLFLLPIPRLSYAVRGLLFSLAPTLATLLLVFPFQAHKGLFGWQLGYLTPLFVLFYNAIWGMVAGLWLHLIQAD